MLCNKWHLFSRLIEFHGHGILPSPTNVHACRQPINSNVDLNLSVKVKAQIERSRNVNITSKIAMKLGNGRF